MYGGRGAFRVFLLVAVLTAGAGLFTLLITDVDKFEARTGFFSMAGTIVNRVRVWRREGNIAMLEQYFGKITTCALRYLAPDDYRELMRSRDAVRVRGTRDL